MSQAHRAIPAYVNGKPGKMVLTVDIPSISTRHIDDLVRSKCFPDLLATGWYPDTKELTESCAAFRASSKLDLDWNDPSTLVVAVGDGQHPRTAAMFAYRTKWTAIAVDPRLRLMPSPVASRRVLGVRAELRAFNSPNSPRLLNGFRNIVFACVHSHAPADELLGAMGRCPASASIHVISIRCCVEDTLPKEPTSEYLDWGIFSPERRVRVWKGYHRSLPPGGSVFHPLFNR